MENEEKTGLIEFFVPGIPKPAGSKRFFGLSKKTGRAIISDDSGKAGQDWRGDVKTFAVQCKPETPWTGPVGMELTFAFPRPKSHFGGGKNADVLKASAPSCHIIKPDATKITRAVEDALTGIIWRDDSQIIEQHIRKTFGNSGVFVRVWEVR